MLPLDLVLSQLDTRRSQNGAKSSAASGTWTCTLFRSATRALLIIVHVLTQVQAKPKNRMHTDPEKLSHHVHRVGHHFPLEIISLACTKFGYIYDERQGLRKDKSNDRTNWIAQRMEDYSSRQQMHGRPHTEKEKVEHTRGAIREMFPKIPEADLTSIVHHAFQEVNR
jgi:hypothetical protein